jgi:hypothetical protein
MTPLTLADYDRTPVPPVLDLPFATRLSDAWPALTGLITAALAMGVSLFRSVR